jgi:predicted DCC family thiol-disulfide oxidoreductase YuxK
LKATGEFLPWPEAALRSTWNVMEPWRTATDRSSTMPEENRLLVCYNGSCPVCRAEIGHYRQLDGGSDALAFLDVAADPTAAARHALVGDNPFRRLHAVTPDGQQIAGLDAFIAVWERLPRYRWLARLASRSGVRPMAGWAYERIAAPLLFALHRWRSARQKS